MPISSLPDHQVVESTNLHMCYDCGQQDMYLFADCRCKDCTRLTPEEVRGEQAIDPNL